MWSALYDPDGLGRKSSQANTLLGLTFLNLSTQLRSRQWDEEEAVKSGRVEIKIKADTASLGQAEGSVRFPAGGGRAGDVEDQYRTRPSDWAPGQSF